MNVPGKSSPDYTAPDMSARLLAYALACTSLLTACGDAWNDPYGDRDHGASVLYTAFTDRPKHLDPVQSYAEDEAEFTGQIYEPPLQYHPFKQPYTLIPLTAEAVPQPLFLNVTNTPVPADSPDVAYSVYEIRIKPGILYQPHPAFARDEHGEFRYHKLDRQAVGKIWTLNDLPATGTRELTAEDYVYQIKRLAHPRLHSPLYGLMSEYIVGLKELADELKVADKKIPAGTWLDLRPHALEGAQVVDRHTYRIKLRGRYPQFKYWLAMSFFAPVPYEADSFYSQPGMTEGKNISLDWYPVGTGPYMLAENDPNARMVLVRNPNFRGELYPTDGDAEDRAAGLLNDAGKPLPFVDRVVFTREKESIPYWNKFLQGYYDSSGISSDSFDQAVQMSFEGQPGLSPEMEAKGIRLATEVEPSIFFLGFNWLDPLVGGSSDRARKLRQAVSIAVDWEEFVSIFRNGRGIVGQGPIPPGLFGFKEGESGINPVVYDWVDGEPRRKPVEAARKLLAEAGYPNGRDAKTGEALVLYLDTTARGPDDKARLDWYRKQFAKLNIQLEIRTTDWNRFQEKVRNGNVQLFFLGWNADYPDPDNFLFLFYGPQSRARFKGENAANYDNPVFDALFEKVNTMDNGPERAALIDQMVKILREDAPWSFGFHPKTYALYHSWIGNVKLVKLVRNDLKYRKIDAAARDKLRREWNRPVFWPLGLGAVVVILIALLGLAQVRRHERARA